MRFAVLLAMSAAASGCWLTVPTCKEGLREATYELDGFEAAPEIAPGAFRASGHLFEGCHAFCHEKTEEPVESCEEPTSDSRTVVCRVRGEVCRQPEVVSPR